MFSIREKEINLFNKYYERYQVYNIPHDKYVSVCLKCIVNSVKLIDHLQRGRHYHYKLLKAIRWSVNDWLSIK